MDASLLKLLSRESDLLQRIGIIDDDIKAVMERLRELKSERESEEDKLRQTRVFIKRYFDGLEEYKTKNNV